MAEKTKRKRALAVKTASFVFTLPLRASDSDLWAAAIRFEIIRQVYKEVMGWTAPTRHLCAKLGAAEASSERSRPPHHP